MSAGIDLLLRTDGETISVQLGPEWYLSQQEIQFGPKDKIEVKGSRVIINGKPALIAAEVVKGNQVLKLRDDNHEPLTPHVARMAARATKALLSSRPHAVVIARCRRAWDDFIN